MNVHLKLRRSPRFSSKVFSPYVLIGVLFAANNLKGVFIGVRLFLTASTDKSAPVSTRNRSLELMSVIHRRLFVFAPSTSATVDVVLSFPMVSLNMVVHTF